MTKSHEHARLLLAKADEDLYALEQLCDDPRSPESVLGFHAQQAAEKSIKAVLTSRAIKYTWTHDLGGLIDLLDDHNIPAPPDRDGLPTLTPFAVEFRYGQLPPEEAESRSLDRPETLDIARRTRTWAGNTLADP